MDSKIEFLVHRILSQGDGVIIQGIVNSGNIKVGDAFLNVHNRSSGEEAINLGKKLISPVIISKIIAYRREIDELPKGMSGELHVHGACSDLIGEHDLLSN